MTTLIALLISILGYGTPSDYATATEAEVINQIEQNCPDCDWDMPSATGSYGDDDSCPDCDWDMPS